MMNQRDEAALFLDVARIKDLVAKFTPISERLDALADAPGAADERSQLRLDLCSTYEAIAPIEQATGYRDVASANLRASIEALLERLANVDALNRLWVANAAVALDQIRDIASIETLRLHSAIAANDQVSPTMKSAFVRFVDSMWDWQFAA